jgi:hypothetical protein
VVISLVCVNVVGDSRSHAHMQKKQTDGLRGFLRSLIGALVLLGIVWLVPPVGQDYSKSFWTVAQSSPWSHPGDWAAAWCSLKIILLGNSIYLFISAFDEISMVFRRDYLSANVFFGLMTIPSVFFLLGAFYLVKALL